MKKNYYVHLSLLLLMFLKVEGGPTISFFFQPEHDIERISQKLRKPGKLAKYTVKGIQAPLVEGIITTYGGYITASDYNGGVVLPRRHQKDAVDILVTPQIIPVPLFDKTVLHWKRLPNVPATAYGCEQKYNEKTAEYYWQTYQVPLTDDMVIPLTAIIIIAKPKNITMKLGQTPTIASANLVLPDLYVNKGINKIENSAYILTIRYLFKPIQTEENREPLKVLTHVID